MNAKLEMLAVADELIRRSERLREAAMTIREEYGIGESPEHGMGRRPSLLRTNGKTPRTQTRVDQIRNFIEKHGPQTRGAIREATGAPNGTISAVLSRYGKREKDGLWALKETE